MKTLLKIAVGAAIAGALVNVMMKQRSRRSSSFIDDQPETDGDQLADTNMVHSADAAQEQRAPQPQEWQGAQNVLDS